MTAFTVYTADNAPEAATWCRSMNAAANETTGPASGIVRQWNRDVQSLIDRLYDEVLHSSSPRGR